MCINVDTKPRASLNVVTFARKHCSLQGLVSCVKCYKMYRFPWGTEFVSILVLAVVKVDAISLYLGWAAGLGF